MRLETLVMKHHGIKTVKRWFKAMLHSLVAPRGRRIFCKDDSIFFLYSLKYFGDDWEGYVSRFWPNFRSSRNHLKSSAIDQESLISHSGIIQTPKLPLETFKKTVTPKSPKFCCPYWSPIGALWSCWAFAALCKFVFSRVCKVAQAFASATSIRNLESK